MFNLFIHLNSLNLFYRMIKVKDKSQLKFLQNMEKNVFCEIQTDSTSILH